MPDRLSAELAALAGVIDLPEPPSIAGRVLADPRLARPVRRNWRPLAAAAAAILAVVLIVPGPRRAIASLLGLGGTTITIVDELPNAAVAALPIGEEVSLDDARAEMPFPLWLPEADPDRVIVDRSGPTPVVTLVYGDRLIITQMSPADDAEVLTKSVLANTAVEEVAVGGDEAYWIPANHVLTYLDEQGQARDIPPRLVANTLLFARDGVTIRLETAAPLAEALTLAHSLTPR